MLKSAVLIKDTSISLEFEKNMRTVDLIEKKRGGGELS